MLRDFPHRQHDRRKVYNVQEVNTLNNVAWSVSWIYICIKWESGPLIISDRDGIYNFQLPCRNF